MPPARSNTRGRDRAARGNRKARYCNFESLRKENAALWNVIDRADGVLTRVINAMAQVKPRSDPAMLRREVEFLQELVGATRTHR